MQSKQAAVIKSPSAKHHLRKGKGFSLGEIKNSGYKISLVKSMGIPIDNFRKSVHESNVELLKQIETPERKNGHRSPFIKKEKKKAAFIAQKITKKKPIQKEEKPEPSKPKKVKKKEKVKKKPVVEETPEKVVKEKPEKGIALTELSGLGPATEKKFIELGVNNVQDLLDEAPEELAPLIKGCSEDRIKNWIEEGKKILEE